MKKQCYPTAAIIVKDKKILLLHRTDMFDVWDLPGGAIEFGESPEQAAIREAKEETGLDVASEGLFTINSHVTPQDHHHIWFYYRCNIVGGDLECKDEDHDQAKWFSFDEMSKIPNLAISVEVILKDLKSIM